MSSDTSSLEKKIEKQDEIIRHLMENNMTMASDSLILRQIRVILFDSSDELSSGVILDEIRRLKSKDVKVSNSATGRMANRGYGFAC